MSGSHAARGSDDSYVMGDIVVHKDFGVCHVVIVKNHQIYIVEHGLVVKGHWVRDHELVFRAVPVDYAPGDTVVDREFGVCTVLKVEEEVAGDANTVCIREHEATVDQMEAGDLGAKMHWVHPSRLQSWSDFVGGPRRNMVNTTRVAANYAKHDGVKQGDGFVNGGGELEIPLVYRSAAPGSASSTWW